MAGAREIETSLQEVVGIGNVTKAVLGAIIIEVVVGENKLPLKCHIVENMKYPMVLGRDMMDCVMIAIDHNDNRIYFKKSLHERD